MAEDCTLADQVLIRYQSSFACNQNPFIACIHHLTTSESIKYLSNNIIVVWLFLTNPYGYPYPVLGVVPTHTAMAFCKVLFELSQNWLLSS